jgi:hypothetical protein
LFPANNPEFCTKFRTKQIRCRTVYASLLSALPDTTAAAELQRLFRRICFLRASARSAEADELEEKAVPAATAALRSAGALDAEISALRVTAEIRIEEMVELAEFLAPLLAKNLNGASGAASNATPRITPPVSRLKGAPAMGAGETSRVPSVADLIDGMLAQDRA